MRPSAWGEAFWDTLKLCWAIVQFLAIEAWDTYAAWRERRKLEKR